MARSAEKVLATTLMVLVTFGVVVVSVLYVLLLDTNYFQKPQIVKEEFY